MMPPSRDEAVPADAAALSPHVPAPDAPHPTELGAAQLSLLSVLQLPITLFWSAVLSQVLAERVEFFAGDKKGLYLAVIGAVGAVASTLIQLLIGPLSDRTTHPRGRRYPFVLWGVALNTIPIMLFAFSGSFAQLMLAFVLIQLLLNVASGPFQAYIPDLVPPHQQGRASGWLGFWTLGGQILGLIVSGFLLAPPIINAISGRKMPDAEARSLGVVFICVLCAAALLTCLVITLRGVREVPLPVSRRLAWPEAVRQSARDAFDWQLRAHRDFARLLVSRFVINMGIYSGIEFLRYYVQEALTPGRDPSLPTMYIGLAVTVGGIGGTFVAGSLADSRGKRPVIYVSCGLAALAAIGFCLTSSLTVALAIGVVFGIGYGAFCAVDWAFATNLMPRGREAKFMAIFHIAFTVPQVLVLTVGGVLGHALGYRTVFWTIPFYLAVGAALMSRVRERHEIERDETERDAPLDLANNQTSPV